MEYILQINPFSLGIFILTVSILCSAIVTKNNQIITISGLMVLAFFVTRCIKEFAPGDDSYMYDFMNDLVVVAPLLAFYKDRWVARLVIIGYALMIAFGYLPKALNLDIVLYYYEILNSIAYLQLFVLIWGVNNGYRSRQHDRIHERHVAVVSLNCYDRRPDKSDGSDKAFKSGSYYHLAENGK